MSRPNLANQWKLIEPDITKTCQSTTISLASTFSYEQTIQQINQAQTPCSLLDSPQESSSVSTPKKTTAKAKPARKVSKTVPKKPAAKEEPTSVAAEVKASDKATAADVLGPDAGTPEASEAKEASTSSEE